MKPLVYSSFDGLEVEYIGPSIQEGIAPTVIYFSLCAHESLSLDPFNQPALALQKEGVRVFSISLPGHGDGFDKYQAMQYWADHLDEVQVFIKKVKDFTSHLVEEQLASAGEIGVMGLSRGGFIALHQATQGEVKAALTFAPVTDLNGLVEFKNSSSKLESLLLKNEVDHLIKKKIRSYIGNRDTRVGTENAFWLTSQIAEKAYEARIRSPQVELFIIPSTGQYGHGTLKKTFEEGAFWLKKQIEK